MAVAQVMYSLPIKLKTFINTSNFFDQGQAHISISIDDQVVSERTYNIVKVDHYKGK